MSGLLYFLAARVMRQSRISIVNVFYYTCDCGLRLNRKQLQFTIYGKGRVDFHNDLYNNNEYTEQINMYGGNNIIL